MHLMGGDLSKRLSSKKFSIDGLKKVHDTCNKLYKYVIILRNLKRKENCTLYTEVAILLQHFYTLLNYELPRSCSLQPAVHHHHPLIPL